MFLKLKKYNIRSFWYYQILGFSIFWASDIFLLLSTRTRSSMEFIGVALEAPLCLLLTLILRIIFKKIKYKSLSIVSILIRIIFWSLLCTIVWYYAIVYILFAIFIPAWLPVFTTLKTTLWWIMVLFAVPFGWSVLYFGIKFWLDWEQEKRKAEKAKVIAQKAQLQMLRYQLNPHFLFNALNSIRALIEEDRKNAKVMLTELSEFLRYSLNNRNRTDVTLHDEINAIQHYLSVEKKRYEEKLDVTYEIDPKAEKVPILNFLIHPLVENALKYGMQTSPMPLNIRIIAKIYNGYLQIYIINSGKWIKPSLGENNPRGTSTGLENVKARLDNAYLNKYKIDFSEKDEEVHVFLEIPKDLKTEKKFN
jgi:LytS/YehU family sensor histidine kinase